MKKKERFLVLGAMGIVASLTLCLVGCAKNESTSQPSTSSSQVSSSKEEIKNGARLGFVEATRKVDGMLWFDVGTQELLADTRVGNIYYFKNGGVSSYHVNSRIKLNQLKGLSIEEIVSLAKEKAEENFTDYTQVRAKETVDNPYQNGTEFGKFQEKVLALSYKEYQEYFTNLEVDGILLMDEKGNSVGGEKVELPSRELTTSDDGELITRWWRMNTKGVLSYPVTLNKQQYQVIDYADRDDTGHMLVQTEKVITLTRDEEGSDGVTLSEDD